MVRTVQPVKKFSLRENQDSYDLQSQLIDKACSIALDEGVISLSLYEKFNGNSSDNILHDSMRFFTASESEKPKLFEHLKSKTANLTAKELEELANLGTILVPVLNAANSVRERQNPNGTAGKLYKNFFLAGLRVVDKGLNIYGMTPKAWVEALAKSKRETAIHITNTSHPTNFYTPVGRRNEKKLKASVHAAIPENGNILPEAILNNAFEEVVKDICRDVKEGRPITYEYKVTVGEEVDTEKDVIKAQKAQIAEVQIQWNLSLKDPEVMQEMSTLSKKAKKQFGSLRLTPQDKKEMVTIRSWILAGADKDGRRESTDVAFYKGYIESLNEKGVFTGPILDLRENAEVRMKIMVAMIARRHFFDKEGDFKTLCAEFCTDETHQPLGKNGFNPEKSFFTDLSDSNKVAFMELLMQRNVDLFNRTSLRNEAIGFNEIYYKVFDELLAENPGLGKNTAYWELTAEQRERLRSEIRKVNYTIEYDHNGGTRSENGFFVFDTLPDETGAVTGFNYNHSVRPPIFKNTYISDEKTGIKTLSDEENLSMISYMRRLVLLNKFIDDQKALGNAVVADRDETANFSNPSDFFSHMYLFQQAGLITIEKGKVTEVKVGLMPLFETTPEIKRGPEIVSQILQSPLAESYYLTRGKAEFMVGYSDGAKSGGNFASHFEIRKFEQEVQKIFKGKFGHDFEVVFKRGPGRGENRGGTRRYDRQHVLHHESVNANAKNHQTLQGDLPDNMAMDPNFGEATLAQIHVSTLAGAVEAQRPKTELEQKRNDSFEAACAWIAEKSAEHYHKGIFIQEEEADGLVKAVIRNPKATSRAQRRADTNQKGIGPQRAITVEYATNIAGLPLHDYGLKHALQEFIKNGPDVWDENSRLVKGQKALEILARDHDFFREEMKLCVQRQQAFEPVLADQWGEKANQKEFVDSIKEELTGLGDLCQTILSGKKVKAARREAYSGEPFSAALALIAQAAALARPEMPEPVKDKFYFAIQNSISNKSGGPLEIETPGLSRPRVEAKVTVGR